jgi:ATP-binding cassette, subfamily G (WHITE), member 2, PDR
MASAHALTTRMTSRKASSISSNTSEERIDTAKSPGPWFEPIQTRTYTRRESASDYQFPMEDQPELARIATLLSRPESLAIIPTGSKAEDGAKDPLERRDTVAGMEYRDPKFDPEKPEFDFYLWARKFLRAIEEEGIKRRRAGFTFKNLSVSGSGAALQLQNNVASLLMAPFRLREYFGNAPEKQILRNFNGSVRSGEMLIVLGRPGSGCSTFLKSICGELAGLDMGEKSVVHYDGITQSRFIKELKGDIVYNQENEKHFPHLTVGETLEFAAAARTPSARVLGLPRKAFSNYMAKITMNIFGLSHTRNTKVGNDFVRGVSGGERKRVSIAEMALAGSPIAAWDNSTRGLDAGTALEFVRSLRISSNVVGFTNAVAIYQASQSIYDIFDKAIVLYEGHQIYFGPADAAKSYFEDMGWFCPSRQTTGDFLTSVTNPQERKVRDGFENKVPGTADDFEKYWLQSENYKMCLQDIAESEEENPIGGGALNIFRESKQQAQAKHVRPKSPYTISIPMQIKLCTIRAYQRLWNDKTSTLTTIIGQIVMALIIGSIFYGTPQSTGAFFAKGSVLFFAVLLNALIAITEINGLYDQRPIVEKHVSYAFYHPFAEALAGIVSDIPVKFLIATCFNIILYFLSGLRYEAGPFFLYFLFNFVAILTMSAIFRTIAAATKAISQALAIAGVLVLAIVIYTGFTVQVTYMHPWFRWINYINPVSYAFEAILANEVHNQQYQCAPTSLVPPYGTGNNFQCAVAGAMPGQTSVLGDDWLLSSYGYSYSHVWRNLGILFAFQIFFYFTYLVATELNAKSTSTAEFLVFRRGHVPKYLEPTGGDAEAGKAASFNTTVVSSNNASQGEKAKEVDALPVQKDIFTWRDVTLDISIKGEPRRLLDHVSGWVKPGTLTALMGVSGAGKTTLLDTLAKRSSIGVLTGDMFVNGKALDPSFQRKTGYVQQQDLHLETTTVREALRFSAVLRQPKSVSKAEKYAFVEEVIKMLSMEDFSEAIVGNPGEGLNVEQRKLLTIGVELAAKPALLLFLDEPTSGLDSQSSWSIIAFLRKLADSGQAVLSTIHQPSAILFQEFDRLLFLAKGGKTVYFGDIGHNSKALLEYFESAGARKCDDEENPAEYMLETVGVGAQKQSDTDWSEVWNNSKESREVQAEIDRIHAQKQQEPVTDRGGSAGEFAMPLTAQIWEVTLRVFQQYWRTPSYIWGKFMLAIASALFIGFSFYIQNASSTGLQNTLFAIFMLTSIFSTLVQQVSTTPQPSPPLHHHGLL